MFPASENFLSSTLLVEMPLGGFPLAPFKVGEGKNSIKRNNVGFCI
jgi:hypothetical protein